MLTLVWTDARTDRRTGGITEGRTNGRKDENYKPLDILRMPGYINERLKGSERGDKLIKCTVE